MQSNVFLRVLYYFCLTNYSYAQYGYSYQDPKRMKMRDKKT